MYLLFEKDLYFIVWFISLEEFVKLIIFYFRNKDERSVLRVMERNVCLYANIGD